MEIVAVVLLVALVGGLVGTLLGSMGPSMKHDTTDRYRYHKYFTSGIRGYEDYKFRGSWKSLQYAEEILSKNGIGWSRLVDSRTGEVVAEFEPSEGERRRVEELNRLVDRLHSIFK